jgi:hypothetical protein
MNSWHDRLIQSGMTAEQANAKQLLLQKCFAALGTENVASVVYAPGRVEFLGKHTDYCGGRSRFNRCSDPGREQHHSHHRNQQRRIRGVCWHY